MRTVSVRLADLQRVTIPIGFAGENLYTRVIIDCKKEFDEHPTAVVGLAVAPPTGDPYPAVVTRDGDFVIWDVTASDVVYDGSGEIQLSFVVDEMIGKTYRGRIMINKSILPNGEAPDPISNWIDRANAALGTIEGAVQQAEDAKDAAIDAKEKAEDAKESAETAQEKAETAEEHAESAQTAAETAQGRAEDARDLAQGYANSAYTDAERAEQAANNLGYMEMEIVNGHLIYSKTELIETDFELVNGHLILEVA